MLVRVEFNFRYNMFAAPVAAAAETGTNYRMPREADYRRK
jgi:hypothetical protein